jgi:hypothetical protein
LDLVGWCSHMVGKTDVLILYHHGPRVTGVRVRKALIVDLSLFGIYHNTVEKRVKVERCKGDGELFHWRLGQQD